MAQLILQVILYSFKVFLEFVKIYQAWSNEEKEIKAKRINAYLENIFQAIKSDQEYFEEKTFLESIKHEQRVRYEQYFNKVFYIIQSGEGLNAMIDMQFMGLGLRAVKIKPEILQILNQTLSVRLKAQLISKRLSEV